jgi:hypothetical protein
MRLCKASTHQIPFCSLVVRFLEVSARQCLQPSRFQWLTTRQTQSRRRRPMSTRSGPSAVTSTPTSCSIPPRLCCWAGARNSRGVPGGPSTCPVIAAVWIREEAGTPKCAVQQRRLGRWRRSWCCLPACLGWCRCQAKILDRKYDQGRLGESVCLPLQPCFPVQHDGNGGLSGLLHRGHPREESLAVGRHIPIAHIWR